MQAVLPPKWILRQELVLIPPPSVIWMVMASLTWQWPIPTRTPFRCFAIHLPAGVLVQAVLPLKWISRRDQLLISEPLAIWTGMVSLNWWWQTVVRQEETLFPYCITCTVSTPLRAVPLPLHKVVTPRLIRWPSPAVPMPAVTPVHWNTSGSHPPPAAARVSATLPRPIPRHTMPGPSHRRPGTSDWPGFPVNQAGQVQWRATYWK